MVEGCGEVRAIMGPENEEGLLWERIASKPSFLFLFSLSL